MKCKFIFYILLFGCMSLRLTYAEETADDLYQKGVLLSEQWQPSADAYIKKAADLGNTKAMCLWAVKNKPSAFIHTEESIKYYEKAKAGGDLCGYDALMTSNDVDEEIRGKTSSKLMNEFVVLAEKKSASGDAEALISLAYFYDPRTDKGIEYLKKSAALNNARAMRDISNLIDGGHDGWYLIPGSRKRAVREWMEKSAEAGNPLAMLDLGKMYYDEDKKKSEGWYKRAVDKGFIEAMSGLASAYISPSDYFSFGYKPKEAYKLLYSISRVIGIDSPVRQYADETLPLLEKKLTSVEIDEVKKESAEWLKTHQIRDYSIEFGAYL